MKKVTYTDEDGLKRAAYVNDLISDPKQGIPVIVPDISSLDWDDIKRELHNALIDNGLYSWNDVQKQQNAITSILRSVILRKIIALYRMED